MVSEMWIFSKLSTDNVKAVTDLEKKLGIALVAFSNDDTTFADLDDAAMKEVKALEDELGVSLIALKM
ncbi:putative xylose isomerase-like sugar epimerase [Methanohalophilus levihalophilus]|uniref:hypothetical protein n=1 Tax=Methanohalophilus levihalophilus TaxID=1431282 RepID=UPI001FD87A1D|nr:hypothetical protein [Methanohalophilus levihalophilus]MBP2029624.1 putative xylose isomerase-like sugar epimerase [Methanohalophilus levihalophilus]